MARFTFPSWTALTRFGTPPMIVVVKPLLYNGVTYDIGSEFPGDPKRPERLRQFYEQRRIVPKLETGTVTVTPVESTVFVPDQPTSIQTADDLVEVTTTTDQSPPLPGVNQGKSVPDKSKQRWGRKRAA